jgi:hypothetical protein
MGKGGGWWATDNGKGIRKGMTSTTNDKRLLEVYYGRRGRLYLAAAASGFKMSPTHASSGVVIIVATSLKVVGNRDKNKILFHTFIYFKFSRLK